MSSIMFILLSIFMFRRCVRPSRGTQVQKVFLSAKPSRSSWSQTKHRKKMCLLVVCMHMHGHSSVCFFCPFSFWCVSKECRIFHFSCAPSSPLNCPATSDATQGPKGRVGMKGSSPVDLLPSCSSNYTVRCPSSILPLLVHLQIIHPRLLLDPGVWWGWIVAGLIVELAVGPRRWVEVYIIAGGFQTLQVHVEFTLRGAPSSVNLDLIEGLVFVVATVGWGRVLERWVGLWRQALRRQLQSNEHMLLRRREYNYDDDVKHQQ